MKKFVTAALFEVGALSVAIADGKYPDSKYPDGEYPPIEAPYEGTWKKNNCCTVYPTPETTSTQMFCLEKDSTGEWESSAAHMFEPGKVLPYDSYWCGYLV